MLRQLKNIDSAFKHVKFLSLFLICACLVFSGYTVFSTMKEVSAMQGKIYILYNGKLLQAVATDRRDNIPVELKDHIKTFHYWFFTMDPDDKENTKHITKALYLADGSAKTVYDNLKENGFYSSVVSGNITQRIETDSIRLDLKERPYHFKYYGTITITRPTSIVVRNLVTEGCLREVSQSDNNPHGYLIEKWQILDNHDLHIQRR